MIVDAESVLAGDVTSLVLACDLCGRPIRGDRWELCRCGLLLCERCARDDLATLLGLCRGV